MRNLSMLHIYFMVLGVQGTDLLPTPVNVGLLSNNFNHTLSWSPGIGTPQGTVYNITVSSGHIRRTTKTRKTAINVSKYMPDIFQQYTLQLFALFGNRSSSVVRKFILPYIDTIIGPPSVTLSGCGDCLNIYVSLPKGEVSKDFKSFYKGITFDILLKKAGDEKIHTVRKCALFKEQNMTLSAYECSIQNLQPGGNYCVQAQPQLSSNDNTQISDWFCAFTNTVDEERGVTLLAGCTTGVVLLGLGLLTVTASLIYTRCFCKWKIPLPKALMLVLPGNLVLFPEETHLSVAEADCSSNSSKPRPVLQFVAGQQEKENKELNVENDDEDDDDNDDGDNRCGYMNRGVNDSDSQATNSGQSSTLCKIMENSGGGCEFPPVEEEDTPSNSITQSHISTISCALHKQLANNKQMVLAGVRIGKPNVPMPKETGQGEKINMANEGTSSNINLSSLKLLSLEAKKIEVDRVSDVKEVTHLILPLLIKELEEDRVELLKPHTRKPTCLGLQTNCNYQRNLQTKLQDEELSKQNKLQEIRSDKVKHDGTQCGYMALHNGELYTNNDCSVEEEEDCCSGYMRR